MNTALISKDFFRDKTIKNIFLDELANLSPLQTLYLARYYYNQGIEFISDEDYDHQLQTTDPHLQLFNSFYEDDPYTADPRMKKLRLATQDLIERLNRANNLFTSTATRYYTSLQDFTPEQQYLVNTWKSSESILAYRQQPEFYESIGRNFLQQGISEAYLSVKYNGWNVASYISPDAEGFVLAHNRSRNSDKYIDMTDLINKITNLQANKIMKPAKIIGELILTKQAFECINYNIINKTPKIIKYNINYPYHSPRSMLTSLVSGTLPLELVSALIYPHPLSAAIKYMCFSYEELSPSHSAYHTIQDDLNRMSKLGLDTVMGSYVDLSQGFKELNTKISNADQAYNTNTNHFRIFSADGLVIEPYMIEDRNAFKRFSELYTPFRTAYKAGSWSKALYTSNITAFEVLNANKYHSIEARIVPTKLERGTISRIPLSYKDILEDKLKIGDSIQFSDRGEVALIYEGKL